MNTIGRISHLKLILLTGLSFILILIPILLFALWNYCFNAHSNHEDRVRMYEGYFPEFLNGRYTLSFISLLLCSLGLVFSAMYWNNKHRVMKAFNIVFFIAGGLMMLLYLFSLM